jgi:hypothetical protein
VFILVQVQDFETSERRIRLPTVAPLSYCTCVVSAVNEVGEGAPSEKPAQLCTGDVIVLAGCLPKPPSQLVHAAADAEADGHASNDVTSSGIGALTASAAAAPPGIDTLVSAPFGGDVWRLRSAPTSSVAFSKIDMTKECVDRSLQGVSIFHVLATSPDTTDLHHLLAAKGRIRGDGGVGSADGGGSADDSGGAVPSSSSTLSPSEGIPEALRLVDDDGRNPLLVAAASLNVQAALMLLDAIELSSSSASSSSVATDKDRNGDDVIASVVGAADNAGNTAAHHIVTINIESAELKDGDGCAVLLTRLAKYTDPTLKNKVGETVFTRALKYGNIAVASWILRRGPFAQGATALDGAGNSALHLGTLLLLQQSTTSGGAMRFKFDEDAKSPFLHLSADCREIVRNDSDGTRSIRIVPAMSSGRHTVSEHRGLSSTLIVHVLRLWKDILFVCLRFVLFVWLKM